MFQTDEDSYNFNYIIVGTGAETNFFGMKEAMKSSYRLRSMSHVVELLKGLESKSPATCVVIGGGYTGLEAASHLRRYSLKSNKDMEIRIVELKDKILPMHTDWMRDYMKQQMAELDIKIQTGCTIDSFEEKSVTLTTGEKINNCVVIWNAGVSIINPFKNGTVDFDEKGQVIVNEYLCAADRCYVTGDSSRFDTDGTPLPLASYLSVQQGKRAARNVLREIRGKKTVPYRPKYYGLVIPLANGRGCGTLFGIKIKGRTAALVHHTASFFRIRNRKTRRSLRREIFHQGIGL
jgi:NADH dehydrogenase